MIRYCQLEELISMRLKVTNGKPALAHPTGDVDAGIG